MNYSKDCSCERKHFHTRHITGKVLQKGKSSVCQNLYKLLINEYLNVIFSNIKLLLKGMSKECSHTTNITEWSVSVVCGDRSVRPPENCQWDVVNTTVRHTHTHTYVRPVHRVGCRMISLCFPLFFLSIISLLDRRDYLRHATSHQLLNRLTNQPPIPHSYTNTHNNSSK